MTNLTDDEFIERELGSVAAKQAYDNLRNAAVVSTTQDALASLLQSFDLFCQKHEIKYFLFADSLKGVLAYNDFIPGDKKINLGMMYSEYEKLLGAWEVDGAACPAFGHPWRLIVDQPNAKGVKKCFPLISGLECVPVEYKGEAVFDRDSFPMEVRYPSIEISIFSAVPDDFVVKKSFFRQARRWNKLFERTISARKSIRKKKSSILGPDLPFALIPLRFSVGRLFSCAKKYEDMGMSSVARMFGVRSKTVSIDSILPYRRDMFHGVEAWVPAGSTAWASYPIDEPDDALRDLQGKALEIVSEIHRVCKELGIGYFVCGGTMLGYVRHGGFIPWDDDIDVGMLREDYDRFLKEAPKIIDSERFFLQTRKTDPNIPYLFSKVRMNGTFYITEYNHYRDFHKGICVDLFPFDAIPNDIEQQKKFRQEVRAVEKRHNSLANHRYPRRLMEKKDDRRMPGRGIAHLVGQVMSRYYDAKSMDETQASFDKLVQRYDSRAEEDGLEYVACFVPSYTMVKRCDLLPYREVDFEGIKVNVPAHPERFLRMQYGDFMALPMPHQRTGHGLLDVDDVEMDL